MLRGEKSTCGLYGRFLNSATFTARVELLPTNTV